MEGVRACIRAQVHDAPGDPVQLHDQERLGFALLEHGQRTLQTWAVQRLRALTSIDDDLDQFQLVELGVGLQLGALRVETDSAVGLLVGRDSQ